ncbi:MAG: hypothetical protein KU28_01450 [Sulfurovum sp. PC08-66]|nr:MAG: hypothetical protein KU28_01450 [Sulfurovum sp. PC08-66]KIM12610.1 MAG: hypothetical protein KU37_01565 [Sulfuricurvum sp. PC08-66]
MKRWTVLLLLSLLFVDAKNLTNGYDVYFSLFGRVASSDAKLYIDEEASTYAIEIYATSRGLANWVTGNAQERHTSMGRVVEGQLLPDHYIADQFDDTQHRINEYRFDYENRIVTKTSYTLQGKTQSGVSTSTLPYFPENDLTTLYFNLQKLIEKSDATEHRIPCAGSDDPQGIILVKVENDTKDLRDSLEGKAGKKVRIVANQKLYGSDKGQLFLNVAEGYNVNAGILKNVTWFGDVVLKQTYFRTKE